MPTNITIHRATVNDAHEIAVMVGELLNEIMTTIGMNAFNFSLDVTKARLHDFIGREKYFVFVAQNEHACPVGFITLFEGHALYAEGAFGNIPDFLFVLNFVLKTWDNALWIRQKLSVVRVAGSALK